MPISFSLPEDLAARILKNGVVDHDEVYVQFLCNTGENGEHDPDAPPDTRVRPSHAAFHGRVFKMSDAPIPPLDYGCRCAIHYVAKPDSNASELIESTADEDPIKPNDATAEWLNQNVGGWDKLADLAKASPPSTAIGLVQAMAKDMEIDKPRAIAEMVVDIVKSRKKLKGIKL